MDAAANYLTAELAPRRLGPFRAALAWLGALVSAALGAGIDGPAPDLVVRRRESGAEVMRTKADVGSPDFLLEQVRQDLHEKTVDEFLAEWRLRDS